MWSTKFSAGPTQEKAASPGCWQPSNGRFPTSRCWAACFRSRTDNPAAERPPKPSINPYTPRTEKFQNLSARRRAQRMDSYGGKGRVQWRTSSQKTFPQSAQVVTYDLPAGTKWQNVTVQLPIQGKVSVIRHRCEQCDSGRQRACCSCRGRRRAIQFRARLRSIGLLTTGVFRRTLYWDGLHGRVRRNRPGLLCRWVPELIALERIWTTIATCTSPSRHVWPFASSPASTK